MKLEIKQSPSIYDDDGDGYDATAARKMISAICWKRQRLHWPPHPLVHCMLPRGCRRAAAYDCLKQSLLTHCARSKDSSLMLLQRPAERAASQPTLNRLQEHGGFCFLSTVFIFTLYRMVSHWARRIASAHICSPFHPVGLLTRMNR